MSQQTMNILGQCTPIFSILQDEKRQQIIVMLFDEKELSVTAITEKMSLSRPAVSHHLRLLLDINLVAVRQEGKERYYRLELSKAVGLLESLLSSIKSDMQEE